VCIRLKGDVFMSGNRSLLKWAFVLVVAGVLFLGLILTFGSYRVYSQMDERLSSISPVSIWFENPQQGSTLPSGNPLLITARAQGPYPILYMQLETEGEVVGIIGAPSAQGVMTLSADFNWQPAEIKTYKLTARAFDTMGNEADATLAIEITAAEQVTEADIQNAYAPVGLHAPSGLGQGGGNNVPPPLSDDPPYQPPALPEPPSIDPNGNYGAAQPWKPSLVNWLDFVLTNPNKPIAPGIPATAVEGCKPRIWISDNSDNEDGFRVFRRDPNSLDFFEIGVEAAYEGPVFTFEDEEAGLFGTYEYRVSAFNQSGESFSNISESVDVDSPNCQPDNQPVLQIDLSKIFALQSYEKGYCYYSLDAEHWQRHPLNPQEFLGSGQIGELPEGVLEILKPQGAQMLDLECWGWAGGLQMIGKWHFEDVLQDHADLGLVTLHDDSIQTYGGSGMGGPWDPALPIPIAFLGSSPEECGAYSNIPNPFVLGLICGDVADDLDFVYWGYLDFSYLVDEEPVDVVGYNVYDTMGSIGDPVKYIEAPATIYFPFDPTACEARLISVTLLANVDGEIHESFPSNQVIYSPEDICGYIAGTEPHTYRVTWEMVDFSVGNIDDGVDVDDDAEGFGYLALRTDTGHQQFWHMPMHDFEDNPEDNPYPFSGIPLSLHDYPCSGSSCYISGGIGAGTGNNTADFPLFIGEGFKLTVYLVDYDDDQAHDVLCSLDPSTSNLTWTGSEVGGPGWVTTVSRTAHHNNADCKVTIKIEGLP
jgi:hypothetical protein